MTGHSSVNKTKVSWWTLSRCQISWICKVWPWYLTKDKGAANIAWSAAKECMTSIKSNTMTVKKEMKMARITISILSKKSLVSIIPQAAPWSAVKALRVLIHWKARVISRCRSVESTETTSRWARKQRGKKWVILSMNWWSRMLTIFKAPRLTMKRVEATFKWSMIREIRKISSLLSKSTINR